MQAGSGAPKNGSVVIIDLDTLAIVFSLHEPTDDGLGRANHASAAVCVLEDRIGSSHSIKCHHSSLPPPNPPSLRPTVVLDLDGSWLLVCALGTSANSFQGYALMVRRTTPPHVTPATWEVAQRIDAPTPLDFFGVWGAVSGHAMIIQTFTTNYAYLLVSELVWVDDGTITSRHPNARPYLGGWEAGVESRRDGFCLLLRGQRPASSGRLGRLFDIIPAMRGVAGHKVATEQPTGDKVLAISHQLPNYAASPNHHRTGQPQEGTCACGAARALTWGATQRPARAPCPPATSRLARGWTLRGPSPRPPSRYESNAGQQKGGGAWAGVFW